MSDTNNPSESKFNAPPIRSAVSARLPAYALICDDHPVVGRGLRELLKEHPHINHSVCTSTAEECLAYIDEHEPPAVVIVDFWLHGDTSRQLVEALKHKGLRVLVISADDDPMVSAKSEQWGADGFISKQAAPGVVREAVSCLIEGLGWFMPGGQAKAADAQTGQRIAVSARELGLTKRQGEVLALMLQCQPNKRIAQELNLTEATVKEHVTGILARLGAKNRVEIVSRFKHRLLEQ
jgi:DNA-binding NarL/FixJ family response regulator